MGGIGRDRDWKRVLREEKVEEDESRGRGGNR